MKKEALIQELENSRLAFEEILERVPEAELETPGACGEWSIKDILVHLTLWEAELIRLLWQVRQGQKPTTAQLLPEAGIEELNQRWHAQHREREYEAALNDFDTIREQTLRRVGAFTDPELNDAARYRWAAGVPLWKIIAESSFAHEAEHQAEIERWLKSRQP